MGGWMVKWMEGLVDGWFLLLWNQCVLSCFFSSSLFIWLPLLINTPVSIFSSALLFLTDPLVRLPSYQKPIILPLCLGLSWVWVHLKLYSEVLRVYLIGIVEVYAKFETKLWKKSHWTKRERKIRDSFKQTVHKNNSLMKFDPETIKVKLLLEPESFDASIGSVLSVRVWTCGG